MSARYPETKLDRDALEERASLKIYYVVTGYGAGRIHRVLEPGGLRTSCGLDLRDGISVDGPEVFERFPDTDECANCRGRGQTS